MAKDILSSFIVAAIIVAAILGLVCFVVWQAPSDLVVRASIAAWLFSSVCIFNPKKW